MGRSSKKYIESNSKQELVRDDYEDFGYKINNAKRHNSRNKSQRKFKDYTEFDDWQHT